MGADDPMIETLKTIFQDIEHLASGRYIVNGIRMQDDPLPNRPKRREASIREADADEVRTRKGLENGKTRTVQADEQADDAQLSDG